MGIAPPHTGTGVSGEFGMVQERPATELDFAAEYDGVLLEIFKVTQSNFKVNIFLTG